jgi:hypothetical protein
VAQHSAKQTSQSWPGAVGIYKQSAAAVMKNSGPVLILFVPSTLLSLFLNLLQRDKTPNKYTWLILLVGSLVSLWLQLGLFKLCIEGSKNKLLSLSQAMRTASRLYVDGFILTVLVSALLILSIVALVVPFFFVAPRLLLAFYYLIDRELGPIDSVKQSWNDSKGHTMEIYGVVLLSIGFAILSIIIIGIYFSFMYQAATALLYLYVTKKVTKKRQPANA